jgi:EAL domain-containing protein (putative c-di-GMP-specific phosphodiesterase class I)
LSYAEISLEKSKSNKNNVKNVFFMREYLDDKNRLSTIQKDLFTACLNGELQVYYQPKVSLVDKEVTGMEALARWTHPSVGYIPPNEFVEIAEKSGHILALGEYVLESAFYHIKQVHKICNNDSINISINISPTQLLESNFKEKILNRAKNFGVDPSVVYLEITEGTMLKSGAQAILQGLKNEGFNLSLDDFGTGYSSLNYLHKYSFDELKIDKSFTDGLMRGRNERKLFRFLILLAKELGMRTVTEGVEDEVQIRLLKNLGAEEIQGWYYSKALPSFDCIEYIRKFRFTDDNADGDPNSLGIAGSFSVVDNLKYE